MKKNPAYHERRWVKISSGYVDLGSIIAFEIEPCEDRYAVIAHTSTGKTLSVTMFQNPHDFEGWFDSLLKRNNTKVSQW